MTPEAMTSLIQTNGLWLLFPLSVAEGPVVSIMAGWLVRLGMLPLVGAYVVLVLGDLVGDAMHYALGRFGADRLPARWRRKLAIDAASNDQLIRHFHQAGGRTLVLAKLTHSLGFAALIGAGAARMPFGLFLWFNLLATLPKSAVFLGLGYALGHLSGQAGTWMWWLTVGGFFAAVLAAGWLHRKRGQRA